VVRNYLDWLLSIPWRTAPKVSATIKVAEKVLNADHSDSKGQGAHLEYLAVRSA